MAARAQGAPLRKRRIAVLGHPAVGKSSLIDVYSEKPFSDNYNTTIADVVVLEREIGTKAFELQLHDTMGVADLPSFDDDICQMHGWILVFDVTSRDSFNAIETIYDKLKMDLGEAAITPLVVVANKCDLPEEGKKREVTKEEAAECAKKMSAFFCESSAKANKGVAELFEQVVREIETARGEPLPKGRGGKKGGWCAQS